MSSRNVEASPRVVVATTAMLSFIGFWQAAAVVLNDLGSSAFYAGGIAEQVIGKSAPWFILAVMLFSYCVRMVYLESSTMFVRGGVYRVVKEAMGGTLAKISVSALVFDFMLTGPISGVSAGQYVVGLLNNVSARTGYPLDLPRDAGAAVFAIVAILYFWRKNLRGIEESSSKAMSIMKVATAMAVLVIGWGAVTLLMKGGRLPPLPSLETMKQTEVSLGWLEGSWLSSITLIALLVGFGHSVLAMSGEETLAQVYREIAHPKVQNLKRAAVVIFVFSAVFTSLVSFYALALIPDTDRPEFYDNLISGIAMHLAGPYQLRLLLQAFVVLVGGLILAGAVNTAIIGSNGVLNRLSEDGVLPDWFREPHPRYGTTHRLLNLVAGLQIGVVILSRGDILVLGEAYAFGVIWSFAMNALSTLILRFKRPEEREWRVPLNLRLAGREIPLGLGLIALVLFATAVTNLFTKKVSTISGVLFTGSLFVVFLVSERLASRRREGKVAQVERFLLENQEKVTDAHLDCRPGSVVVAVRDYRSLYPLVRVLEKTNTKQQDIVVLTVRRVAAVNPGLHPLAADQIFTDYEQLLFSKVVSIAERAGKKVELLVVPGASALRVSVQVAVSLQASKLAVGVSNRMSGEEQARLIGEAWEAVGGQRALTLELIDQSLRSRFFDLGPHPPRLWPQDVALVHDLWLKLTRNRFGARLHHRDVVGVALKRLHKELESEQFREQVLQELAEEIEATPLQPPVIEGTYKAPEGPRNDTG